MKNRKYSYNGEELEFLLEDDGTVIKQFVKGSIGNYEYSGLHYESIPLISEWKFIKEHTISSENSDIIRNLEETIKILNKIQV